MNHKGGIRGSSSNARGMRWFVLEGGVVMACITEGNDEHKELSPPGPEGLGLGEGEKEVPVLNRRLVRGKGNTQKRRPVFDADHEGSFGGITSRWESGDR